MAVDSARERLASSGRILAPPLRRFRLSVALEHSTPLPPHTGSLLRGALGHALLNLACDCGSNAHQPGCQYQQLFAPRAALPGLTTPPPPLLITPPAWHALARPMHQFDMQVSLLGPAREAAPLIMSAIQQALRGGIGDQRVAARVIGVEPETSLPVAAARALRIRLMTPLLIKRQQDRQGNDALLRADDISGRDWLLALHHRLALLDSLYGLALPPLDADTVHHACTHLGSQRRLRDICVSRRSNRQHKMMSFPAVIGELELYNLPEAMQPWLALGQWLHVGSKAALGFGAYSMEEITDYE